MPIVHPAKGRRRRLLTNTILADKSFMARDLEWKGVVPKAGLRLSGLLKSLMDWAIPAFPLMIAQTVIASLYLSVSVFGSVCHEK